MIYENHFALNQRPFTIAPNPQFLYAEGQYQEALAALEYGIIHRGGFVLLTGEVGTGKTTLCKHILDNIPSNTEVALVLHPQLDRLEMLQLVCRELCINIGSNQSEYELIERLTGFLLDVYSKGGYSVLIIDEAQHLDGQVLELVRLLTNLETHQDKLLQIILLGQPELKARLQRYDLRQLNQRFTARYHLNALNYPKLCDYVAHRLLVAGSSQKLFSSAALYMLYKISGGVPRLINLIADRSLMGGYALNKEKISAWMVYRAAKEVMPEKKPSRILTFLSYGFVLAFVFLFGSLFFKGDSPNNIVLDTQQAIESTYGDVVFSITGKYDKVFKNTDDCGPTGVCWQGKLPAELMSPNQRVNVYSNGQWVAWTSIDQSRLSGLISVQLTAAQKYKKLNLKLGDSHMAILWVRKILQESDLITDAGTETSRANEGQWQVIRPDSASRQINKPSALIYDSLLEMQVQIFQKQYGLTVDGVIGRQTLISLELLENMWGKK
jgi:type II secretory pathway predicted ATPase ExeA